MKDGRFNQLKKSKRKELMTGLKSILQAITTRYCAGTFPITTYPISVFKFLAGLCDDLMQMIKNFRWDDDNERRRIH
jgi:hypothetical protein